MPSVSRGSAVGVERPTAVVWAAADAATVSTVMTARHSTECATSHPVTVADPITRWNTQATTWGFRATHEATWSAWIGQ